MPSTTDDFSRLRPGWRSTPVGRTLDLRNVTDDVNAYNTETEIGKDSFGGTTETGNTGQQMVPEVVAYGVPSTAWDPNKSSGMASQVNFDQGLASLHTGQNLMDLNEGLEPTPLVHPQQGGGPIGFLKKLINIAVMMSPAGKAITVGKILQQLQQAPDKMVFMKKLGTNLAQMVARNKLGADRFDLARSGYNLATDKSSFGDEAGRLVENKAYRMGNEAILKNAYERGGMDDVRRTAALLKAGGVPTGR